MFDHIAHPKKRAFLAAYQHLCNVRRAAKEAGIARETHYDWLHSDAEYAAAFERARLEAVEGLVEDAYRRARFGVLEPVYQMGERVGLRRRYSDGMVAMLLKIMHPAKYGDKPQAHVHSGEVKHTHGIDLSALTDEELTALEHIARRARKSDQPGSAGGGTPAAPAPQD